MQRSAFIIALFSLFAFFSLALASPLPVQAVKEMREVTAELSAREVAVDLEILHREVTTGTEPETNVARDTQDVEPRICRPRMCI